MSAASESSSFAFVRDRCVAQLFRLVSCTSYTCSMRPPVKDVRTWPLFPCPPYLAINLSPFSPADVRARAIYTRPYTIMMDGIFSLVF